MLIEEKKLQSAADDRRLPSHPIRITAQINSSILHKNFMIMHNIYCTLKFVQDILKIIRRTFRNKNPQTEDARQHKTRIAHDPVITRSGQIIV